MRERARERRTRENSKQFYGIERVEMLRSVQGACKEECIINIVIGI